MWESTKADKKIKKLEGLKCKRTCPVTGELKSNMTLSVLYVYEELMEWMIFLQILCIEYVVWCCLVEDLCTVCGCQEIQKKWGKEVGTVVETLRLHPVSTVL
jgi:hypothetical protein